LETSEHDVRLFVLIKHDVQYDDNDDEEHQQKPMIRRSVPGPGCARVIGCALLSDREAAERN
jgi:hypothetical protein